MKEVYRSVTKIKKCVGFEKIFFISKRKIKILVQPEIYII